MDMLRCGIVGASRGAFIADVHLRALEATREAVLVAGCFSRDEGRALEAASHYGVGADRCYRDYEEMAGAESRREDGIDFVVITAPNYLHYPCAIAFLERGIAVSCDKPVALSGEEAAKLAGIAAEKGIPFCVTYTYFGLPALRKMRELVAVGEIGEVHMVMGENVQDWMLWDQGSGDIAGWREDPELAGRTNCLGDIGTHVAFAAEFVTGLQVEQVCCRLGHTTSAGGLDTNAAVMVQYRNGADGVYWASQVACGNDNGMRLRVYGGKGALEWRNEEPELIRMTRLGSPTMLLVKGKDYPGDPGVAFRNRLPSGHAEGWHYAFADIYQNFVRAVTAWREGREQTAEYPSIRHGLAGMRFVDACLQSWEQGSSWVAVEECTKE